MKKCLSVLLITLMLMTTLCITAFNALAAGEKVVTVTNFNGLNKATAKFYYSFSTGGIPATVTVDKSGMFSKNDCLKAVMPSLLTEDAFIQCKAGIRPKQNDWTGAIAFEYYFYNVGEEMTCWPSFEDANNKTTTELWGIPEEGWKIDFIPLSGKTTSQVVKESAFKIPKNFKGTIRINFGANPKGKRVTWSGSDNEKFDLNNITYVWLAPGSGKYVNKEMYLGDLRVVYPAGVTPKITGDNYSNAPSTTASASSTAGTSSGVTSEAPSSSASDTETSITTIADTSASAETTTEAGSTETDESTPADNKDGGSGGGISPVVWVIAAAVIVAGAGAGIFFIMRKKKT